LFWVLGRVPPRPAREDVLRTIPVKMGVWRSGYFEGFDRKFREAIDSMARETGLEPATSGVTGRRSNQLSYSRVRANPRDVGDLKGRPIEVKDVAKPGLREAFLRRRCKKRPVFGENSVVSRDPNQIGLKRLGFPALL
jgi:hypothetical protein